MENHTYKINPRLIEPVSGKILADGKDIKNNLVSWYKLKLRTSKCLFK